MDNTMQMRSVFTRDSTDKSKLFHIQIQGRRQLLIRRRQRIRIRALTSQLAGVSGNVGAACPTAKDLKVLAHMESKQQSVD